MNKQFYLLGVMDTLNNLCLMVILKMMISKKELI